MHNPTFHLLPSFWFPHVFIVHLIVPVFQWEMPIPAAYPQACPACIAAVSRARKKIRKNITKQLSNTAFFGKIGKAVNVPFPAQRARPWNN
jgi:hypothetical protein